MNAQTGKPHHSRGYIQAVNPLQLFADYLQVTGVAHTGPELYGDPHLIGKRLGLLNGSSWITLWSNYFGHLYLPGVHLVNAGNEALQINFMEAYEAGQIGLPAANLAAFKRYAIDLAELGHVDAVLITCSTMNRSYPEVRDALQPYKIPVFQIDRPMMERALKLGSPVLIMATHGPTLVSTRALLQEVAAESGESVTSATVLVESAWEALARGKIKEHNEILAQKIMDFKSANEISCVVMAQLSMSIFLLSFPDPVKDFGIPVFTSGQCGFEAMSEVLASNTGTF